MTPHELFPRFFTADAHKEGRNSTYPFWFAAARGTDMPGTFFEDSAEQAATKQAELRGLGFKVSDVYPTRSA